MVLSKNKITINCASQNKLINEIEVGNNQNKLKTIEHAYKSTSIFKFFPIIKFALKIINQISDYLRFNQTSCIISEIKTKIEIFRFQFWNK